MSVLNQRLGQNTLLFVLKYLDALVSFHYLLYQIYVLRPFTTFYFHLFFYELKSIKCLSTVFKNNALVGFYYFNLLSTLVIVESLS